MEREGSKKRDDHKVPHVQPVTGAVTPLVTPLMPCFKASSHAILHRVNND